MKQVPEQLTKPFEAKSVEAELYKMWEESGYFNPDNLPKVSGKERTENYSIILPPPNVTGVLHLGHAYEDSLQDTLIRFARMQGKRTLWLPGTDSAAIATQARVEKNIQKEEGKSRHDLGREEIVKRVSEFAKQSENTILSQVKKLGSSLDWSRYAYTLDEQRNNAVFTAFKRMYDVGLIYRGNRVVNWDPKGQTTISDDEIVNEEKEGTMYTFKYSADFPIAISSTRPETKVGDTAVAVHPDDERYKEFIGKTYTCDFAGSKIEVKIIADHYVDKDFGTGALGVTPAHSKADWEIKERHNLPIRIIINEYAKMTEDAGTLLVGKKVTEARDEVVKWLKENNLLISEEKTTQQIPTAERTGGIIEPLPKLQWFIDVNKIFTIPYSEIPEIESGSQTTLKDIMRKSVESGSVEMPQENFRKSYSNWIDNLHDWCISRQIWFGHRIPIYYKDNEIICSLDKPEGDGWIQDHDVLDTWFSSSLWTFSTLGWPNNTSDLKKFHPTTFMCPAYEILNLWVSRMILMSGFHLGQVPFKKVMLHGIVRDTKGRKFSKSLDNGIDPLVMIEKYGADALRMGLLSGTVIGNDIKFDENKVKAYKLFANKIWNATRFVLERTNDYENEVEMTNEDKKVYNSWIEKKKDITSDLENYRLHLASEKIYDYFWKEFCDQIIETRKTRILENSSDKASAQKLLLILLREQIIVIHPFMPFITEEVWKYIKNKEDNLLIVTSWGN